MTDVASGVKVKMDCEHTGEMRTDKMTQIGDRMRRKVAFQATLLTVFMLALLLGIQSEAEAKWANAGTATCATSGCHPKDAVIEFPAVIDVAYSINGGASVSYAGGNIAINAGDTIEFDWKFTNLGYTNVSGAGVFLPSGWTPAVGTSIASAVPSWNTVWNVSAGGTWDAGIRTTEVVNAPDGYLLDFTASGYGNTSPSLADDGAGVDLDGTLNLMGADVSVLVPGGATTGIYEVHVFGAGKGKKPTKAQGIKASIVQMITLDVTGGAGNNNPDAPTGLAQFKSDGTTPIAGGGTTTETTVKIEADISDPDGGDTIKLQVDIDGDATFDCESVLGANPSTNVQVSCTVVDGNSYDWLVRTVDNSAATSAWTPFAGSPDFSVDATAPSVTTTVPANTATGVALDSNVTINFDENVDCGTVNTTNITSDSPGWAFSSCSTSQAIFTTSGQANNTTYNLNVTTAVTDVAGNPLSAAYPFSYTTVAAGNNNPNAPTNPAQYKSDGLTTITSGADTNETSVVIEADISDPDGGDTVKLEVDIDGNATVDCSSALVANPSTNVQVTCSSLTNGVSYDWQIRTADNSAATSAWSPFAGSPDFTVDTTAPSVSSTTPTNGATGVTLDSNVTINFNDNLDCTTVNTTNITSDSPGWTFSSCAAAAATFTTSGQANNTLYNVNVTTAVKDDAGNAIGAAYPFSFTTTAGAANNTTAGTASATPGNTVIDITAPYTDDDNANNTVTFEVDIEGDWSGPDYQTATPAHSASPTTHQFTGLTNGQSYEVRVTYNDGDGVSGTSPQTISNVTPVAFDPMVHSYLSTGSTKHAGDGGWGTAGTRYGEFTCATCHTKSTTNIKRVKTAITTPDTGIATLPGDGQPIVFLDATDTTSDFGDDSSTHVTSDKICEICHTYDAGSSTGVKQHAYNMGVTANHYNNKDCTACHKHNQGFTASGDCDGCHGYPPDAADGFGYQAVEGKGAHLKHSNHLAARAAVTLDPTVDQYGDATVTAVCGVCHDMTGAQHETGGGNRNINFDASTTYQFGASAPTYNGVQGTPSSTTAKSCSNVSCHFKETPVWE